jgi:hypothetical protein
MVVGLLGTFRAGGEVTRVAVVIADRSGARTNSGGGAARPASLPGVGGSEEHGTNGVGR